MNEAVTVFTVTGVTLRFENVKDFVHSIALHKITFTYGSVSRPGVRPHGEFNTNVIAGWSYNK